MAAIVKGNSGLRALLHASLSLTSPLLASLMGAGGGGGGGTTMLWPKLGIIPIDLDWYYREQFFTDLFQGTEWQYLKAGVSTTLPQANQVNHYPNSVPGDSSDGIIYRALRYPSAPGWVTLTVTGPTSLVTVQGPDITNFSAQGGGVYRFQFTAAQPEVNIAQLKIIPTGQITSVTVVPDGLPNQLWNPTFLSKITSLVKGGAIRFIKMNPAVELGTTVTARNTPSSGEWVHNDGLPMEHALDLCTQAGAACWYNFGLNEADSVIIEKLQLVDAWLAGSSSRRFYPQSSNEDWNSTYWGNVVQLRALASANGTDGPIAGAAISSITFSGTTATVTTSTAHGRASGATVTVSGATPAAYNVTDAVITVTGTTTFTYTMASTPATNATVVGSYVYKSDIFGGQLRESARRSLHIMSLVETYLASHMSQVTRVLGGWNAVATTASTQLAFSTTPAHHDVLAIAPYWGYQDDPSTTFVHTGTYTSADLPALFASIKAGTKAVLANTASNIAVANTYGLGVAGYEFGQGSSNFDDLTFATLVQKASQMYDAYFYAIQEWDVLTNGAPLNLFVMTDPISSDNNHGWGLQEYGAQIWSKAATPKAQAVLDYIAGTRLPNDLEGSLSVPVAAPAGTVVGTLLRRVRGSTITSSNAAFAVDSSGVVTVVSSAGLIAGNLSVTFTETHSGFPTGSHATSVTVVVTPALLTDNFNDNSLDGAKWTTGVGLISVSGVLATGVSLAEVNQQIEITEDASGTANRGMALQSVADVDLAATKSFVKQPSSGATARAQGIAFGTPGGNVFHVNRANGRVELRAGDASYSFLPNTFAAATYTIAAYPWVRVSKVGANLVVEVAPAAASNPPASGDWVTVATNTWPASVPTSAKIGVFQFNAFGGTANAKYVFDGFNTAT